MNPTLYLAWLSHPEDGGYFAPEDSRGYVATDGGNSWSKYGPLHLSLHTRREAAEAALRDAILAEWDRAALSLTFGPSGEIGDPVEYARRFVGYEAHVTEHTVNLP
jgi:hypothetical protein